MLNMILLFIGTTEIIVIGGIALLLFGGKKLPELMRGLGKGVKEVKEEITKDEQESEVQEDPQQKDQSEETPQEPKDE